MAAFSTKRWLTRAAVAPLAGVLLLATGCSDGADSADDNGDFGGQVTLTFGHPFPPTDPIQVNVWEPWVDEIREATDGTVEIEIHAGGALAPAPQVYENVVAGAQDIGWTMPGYTPGRFPITQVIEAPFAFSNAVEGTEVGWELWEEFEEFQAEYDDVEVLSLWAMDTGDLFTRDQPVETMEDLAGLTIRSPAPLQGQALEAMGASAVNLSGPEIYDAVERGVIDGYKLANSATRVFDLGDTTGYRTVCNCYTGAFVLAINPQSWDRLSPAQQEVITEHTGPDLALRLAGEHDAMAADVADNYWPEHGVESVELSEAEFERWQDAVAPVYDQWASEQEEAGVPGTEMVDRIRARDGAG
ncbi:TRAP transporter substrate-binding protein [Natronosporangium hydrolyticum]|uniref:TRAP transporter substrate-binding protein n=1 Tax=Natronosporangium hydrolyticum TaxID=2811111 RepID=A0A895YFG9_9ACTN|nr:TRAP transporter substrate-binding protein [Natronosporangium hydrolyticum]QSB16614.1 TRAP transporter substrate-binding protein [Natronosporangium hydrolyticum]